MKQTIKPGFSSVDDYLSTNNKTPACVHNVAQQAAEAMNRVRDRKEAFQQTGKMPEYTEQTIKDMRTARNEEQVRLGRGGSTIRFQRKDT